MSFILVSTMAEISSGAKVLVSPLYSTWMSGFSAGPDSTLNGQCFMSLCTADSPNLRPMRRFASNTVLAGFIATWFLAAEGGGGQQA